MVKDSSKKAAESAPNTYTSHKCCVVFSDIFLTAESVRHLGEAC